MFDSITLGPFGSPIPSIDAGLLAECLLFYKKVRVVTGASVFRTLVRTCGAEELLELCGMGNLEIEFLENMTAIMSRETNVGVCHDMGLIKGNASKFQMTARVVADEEAGGSGRRAKRIFDALNRAVKRGEYDEAIIRGSQEYLTKQTYLEDAIKRTLAYVVPEYNPPTSLLFRPEKVPNLGIRYATNIDFTEANSYFHRHVSAKDAVLTPAYLLAQITSAEPDIIIASRSSAEFAVDPFKSMIVSSRIRDVVQKASLGQERLEPFQELIVGGSRSVREAVNSGDRTFRDVVRLVAEAEKFKVWLSATDEDVALRDEYCKSVASIDWADRLAPKSLRFLVMTGLSAAAGILMTPAAGVAAGIGLSATDYFLLDRLVKGWRPNQFIEGTLKHFVEKPAD